MRHGKRFNHLGRTASHRKAMLSNMASSLILHKRISTTVAKAKALRKYVEPLITKSRTDSTHSRRVVFSYLQDKESVKILFDEISEKVSDRPGGYTRIIKTGSRLGDNAEMCIMELVDYNELLLAEKEPKKAKTRRSRRGKKSTVAAEVKEHVDAKVEDQVAEEMESTEAKVVEDQTSEAIVESEGEDKVEVEEENVEETVADLKPEEVEESETESPAEESEEKKESESEDDKDSKKD